MNKVIVKGRLTGRPTTKVLSDEKSVTRFNIAVDRKTKDEEKKTDYINVVAWNKQGEFIEKYFDKGQEILISGRLEVSQYVDENTQKKLSSYSVVVEEAYFCGTKKEQKEEENFDFTNNENVTINFEDNADDDLPF